MKRLPCLLLASAAMAGAQAASAASVEVEIPGDDNCIVHGADAGKPGIQVPCTDAKALEAAFKKAASNPPAPSVSIQLAGDVHYLALFNAIGAANTIPGISEYRIGTASRQVLMKSPPAGSNASAPVMHLGVTKSGALVTWIEKGQVTDPKAPKPLRDVAALHGTVAGLQKQYAATLVSLDVDRDAPVQAIIDAVAAMQDSGLSYFVFLGQQNPAAGADELPAAKQRMTDLEQQQLQDKASQR